MAQGEEARTALPVAEVSAASRDMLHCQLDVIRTCPVAGFGPVQSNPQLFNATLRGRLTGRKGRETP